MIADVKTKIEIAYEFTGHGTEVVADIHRSLLHHINGSILATNIAFGEKEDGSDGVPPADDNELEVFRRARRFLPPSVFDETMGHRNVHLRTILYRLDSASTRATLVAEGRMR